MGRKKGYESHMNPDRWMVSYADFITLLLAVFVVMYAISRLDSEKMSHMMGSMQKAFHSGLLQPGSSRIALSPGTATAAEKQISGANKPLIDMDMQVLQGLEQTMSERLQREDAADYVTVFKDQRGLVISLAETGFFDSGRAELKPASLKILDAIAESLLTADNPIRIEGHTDDVPIHNARFSSNWELSSARSAYVINYLLRHFPFAPQRLSVAGYGQYHPIADNDTDEGRARNRRVDIVLLSKTGMNQEPK